MSAALRGFTAAVSSRPQRPATLVASLNTGSFDDGAGGHSLQGPLCFQSESVLIVCLLQQSSSGDVMIRNIQLKHSGRYVCMVRTGVDSVSSAADLIVRGKQRCLGGFLISSLPSAFLPAR